MSDPIEWQHVTGAWKVTDYDSRDDVDVLPEQMNLKGRVIFRASFDALDRFEAITVPDSSGSYSLSLREMIYPVVRGRLIDRQGNDGVMLPAVVGGVPIMWEAVPDLQEDPGTNVKGSPVRVDRVRWTPPAPDAQGRRKLNLADVAATDREYAEPIVSRVALLVGQSLEARNTALAARDDSLEGASLSAAAATAAQEAETASKAARDDSLDGAAVTLAVAEQARQIQTEINTARTETLDSAAVVVTSAELVDGWQGQAKQARDDAIAAKGVATTKAGEASQSALDAKQFRDEAQGWVGAPDDNSVSTAKLQNGSVTKAKLAPDAVSDKADLVGGKVPQSQIPAIAVTEFLGNVASEAAMLALVGQRGDWCNRTDKGTEWQLVAEPSTSLASWMEKVYPDSPVASVAGRTGAVTLSADDLTDAGTAGKAIVKAADAATARTAISAASQAAVDGKLDKSGTATGVWMGSQAELPATGQFGVLYVVV